MSLLLTSCTMGKQPDRLLNKGPQYLRTRTNAGLFAQRKQSAVELLAASKAQFYSSKQSVDLDKQQDLAVTDGQNQRFKKGVKTKEPSRSKSEYDLSHLSQLHLAITDDESDENNNDISDDSIIFSKDETIKDNQSPCFQSNNLPTCLDNSEGKKREASELVHPCLSTKDAFNFSQALFSSADISQKLCPKPQPKLAVLQTTVSTATVDELTHGNVENSRSQAGSDEIQTAVKKPVPLPRKLKEKPTPSPRKRTLVLETTVDSNLCPTQITSISLSLRNTLPPSKDPIQDTQKLIVQSPSPAEAPVDGQRKQSLVESLAQSFGSPLADSQPSLQSLKELKSSEYRAETENTHTYTATLVRIHEPHTGNHQVQARKPSIVEDGTSSCLTPTAFKVLETSPNITEVTENLKGRKRCPDIPTPARPVTRVRRSLIPSVAGLNPGIAAPSRETVDKSSSLSPSKLEMSIESVDQAVYESEISALPSVSVETSNMQEVDQETREITRSNSSLSGKIDQQNSSPLSMSPTPHYSSVPRSYSDISCHLEGQHSRDSSIVSNHSRLSRASVGHDLENFFNQMGLEKGVLEPLNRFKELQTSEVFDSMSSLDSHDAASICSTFSRSEHEWSDSQSTDRSQHQTSIIERNARIIKWLCNVRRAKGQAQKSDGASASSP